MSLQWDDVRMFVALMQAGSLTRAAKLVAVDVSTLSRRLSALESALGATLFVRSREGLRPTAAAEELLPDAEMMAETASRLSRVSEGLEVAPEGVVRLTAPPTVAETVVVPLLPPLLGRYPKLKLEVVAALNVLDLTRREADLAIRTVRPTSGELVVTKLLEAPYGLFGTTELVRRTQRSAGFDGVPVVTWTTEGASIPAAKWVNENASAANVVLRTNSMAAQLEAVRLGIGVGLLPKTVAGALPDVVPFPLKNAAPFPTDVLWLVGHQALRRVPRVQAVWDFFRDVLTSSVVPQRVVPARTSRARRKQSE